VHTLHGHSKKSGAVEAVAFSPDGKQVISGSEDMSVKIWDAETGAVVSLNMTSFVCEF